MKLNARIVWHLEDPIKELVVTDIELSSNDPGELYLQIIILIETSQTTTIIIIKFFSKRMAGRTELS